jgi:hypothetical protein
MALTNKDPSEKLTAAGKRKEYIDQGLEDIEAGDLGFDAATQRQLESQALGALRTTPTEELRRGGAAGTALMQGGATEGVAAATEEASKAVASITPELAAANMTMAEQQRGRIEEMMMQPTFWEQKRLQKESGGMLKGLIKGFASGLIKKAITGLAASCWVAREVVPDEWEDCRVYILMESPPWFHNLYMKHGQQFANYIHDKPAWKWALRPLFRYFAWRGRLILKGMAEWVSEV